ncbi:MAG: hypothetical protein ACRD1H_13585, partial [Vicinamibacterales bacterium]
ILVLQAGPADAGPGTFTAKELADYRLSLPVFEQFDHASRLIAAATRDDPNLAENPLFTREVSVLGDAPVMAAELEARLRSAPALAAALRAADISARDYTKFALSLFAARLAHGFVKSGALRIVPPGVATDNVAFVEAHQVEIAAVLQLLGLETPQQAR